MKCLQADEKASAVRDARRRTVKRIIDVANAQQVDFILVAGDQFEERTPRAGRALELLAEYAR
jgi:DNA repair exonuclease SbcCD nuclease subunit